MIETMNAIWTPYKDVDFADPSAMQFHVDTRDFNVMVAQRVSENAPDLTKLLKYPGRFFRSAEEVKELLNRYFEGSGGENEWRYFTLEGVDNWRLKYLRIYRTEHGLLVCDSYDQALSKSVLDADVAIDAL